MHRVIVAVVVVVAAASATSAAAAPSGLQRVGADARLTDLHSDLDVELPDLVFNSVDAEYLLVWRDERTGNSGGIYGQRLSPTADRLGTSFRISAPVAEWTRNPAVAHNSVDNEYLIVWRDDRNWETRRGDIFGQRLGPDGARLGKSFRISGSGATGRDDYPAVVHNPLDNEYLVVWGDERNEATRKDDIFGQLVAGDGTKVQSNFRVTGANATASVGSAAAVHNVDANQYLVAWVDGRDPSPISSEIYATILGADGRRARGDFRVGGNPEGSDLVPAVARSPEADEYAVVWWDERRRHIIGRRLAADGTRLGPARRVSGANANADGEPAIAYEEAAGGYILAWNDDRGAGGGSRGIFGQQLDDAGGKVGSNFRVSGHTGLEPTGPRAAANSVGGEFLVAWLDFRLYEEWGLHVYGRRLAPQAP